MKRYGVPVVFLILSAALPAENLPLDAGHISKDGLSREQARQVLTMVLRHEGYKLGKPGMYIEDLKITAGNDPHPGYFDFGLSYDTPKAGATAVLGSYAVSRMTGDVWETNLCKRYSFVKLRRLQKIISERTGKSFAGEDKERSGLGC